jgi:hypothetical protein
MLPVFFKGAPMRLMVIVTCYIAALLAFVSIGLVGVSVFTSPGAEPDGTGERPKLMRRADRNSGEQQQIPAQPPAGAFRYGPEVNHGSSDTRVNYSQQALREARSAAPARNTPRQGYGRGADFVANRPSGH